MVSAQTITLLRPQLGLIREAYGKLHAEGLTTSSVAQYARSVWTAFSPLTRSALLDLRRQNIDDVMVAAAQLANVQSVDGRESVEALKVFEALAVLANGIPIVEREFMEALPNG